MQIGKNIGSKTVKGIISIDIKMVEEKFKKSKNSVSIINTAIGNNTDTVIIST